MRVGSAVQAQVQWFACAWRGWRACSGAYMRTTHHVRHCCAQNADHLAHGSPLSAFLAEVVCSLAATPPQTTPTPTKTTPAPPPIGGNCIIRAATRRRYTASQLLMLQNPHWPPAWRARRDRWAWLRCPWAVAGPGRASSRPRRAKLAARTTRGRAAAHGHNQQPGPTGRASARNTRGATSKVRTEHTRHTRHYPEHSGRTQQRARSAAAPRAPHVCQWLTG